MLDVTVSLSQTSRPHRRGSEVQVVSTARLADGTSAPGEIVWECTNTFVFFHSTKPCATPRDGVEGDGEGASQGEILQALPEPVLREALSFETRLGVLFAGLWCFSCACLRTLLLVRGCACTRAQRESGPVRPRPPSTALLTLPCDPPPLCDSARTSTPSTPTPGRQGSWASEA